jgi:hypothetical protein
MLIKLYDLKDDWSFIEEQEKIGITIKKPIGPEKQLIVNWISKFFNSLWASEADVAISNIPKTCFVAVKREKLIGFSCYDATVLGFLGPIGVEKSNRKMGTGRALMLACLLDMKLKGYGYAIVGDVNNTEFFKKNARAVEILDSTPGIYKNLIKNSKNKS